MFTAIAPRYDLLNHVLSLNIDRLWWRRTAAKVLPDIKSATSPSAGSLLWHRRYDICFANAGHVRPKSWVQIFLTLCCTRAGEKSEGTTLRWVEADALTFPFADESFDLVTSAFGFRNLADYDAGLSEIARVLRPGGECGILDFGEPGGIIGKLYRFYFRSVLPKVGTLISGVSGPMRICPRL